MINLTMRADLHFSYDTEFVTTARHSFAEALLRACEDLGITVEVGGLLDYQPNAMILQEAMHDLNPAQTELVEKAQARVMHVLEESPPQSELTVETWDADEEWNAASQPEAE